MTCFTNKSFILRSLFTLRSVCALRTLIVHCSLAFTTFRLACAHRFLRVRWSYAHRFNGKVERFKDCTCRCDVRILIMLKFEFIVLVNINHPFKTYDRNLFLNRKEHSFLKLMCFCVFMILIHTKKTPQKTETKKQNKYFKGTTGTFL